VLPDHARKEARQFLAQLGLNPARPILFIQPFTSNPKKNWPLENYLAVASYSHSRGMQVLFGGGPSEAAALGPVRAAGFCTSAGATLLLTAGLIDLSTLTLGGDTGLLHLAVTMNKRVIMLMASMAPGKAHPFQHPDWALVSADNRNIRGIEVRAVIETSTQVLADMKHIDRRPYGQKTPPKIASKAVI
jgi:ADP-heptose:LPS heptosyltransferase